MSFHEVAFISNHTIAKVLFEIQDQSTDTIKSYQGILKKEDCHQVSNTL